MSFVNNKKNKDKLGLTFMHRVRGATEGPRGWRLEHATADHPNEVWLINSRTNMCDSLEDELPARRETCARPDCKRVESRFSEYRLRHRCCAASYCSCMCEVVDSEAHRARCGGDSRAGM